MAETATRKMTVDEFFAWQAEQDHNYELVDGVPVMTVKAMTGASSTHDRVTVNAIVTLGYQLRGKSCRPTTSDISVQTFRGTRRPDITIECGRPGPRDMEAKEPRVVIEVLSPSTMRFDRFEKVAEYHQHPTIKVILLVDTEMPKVTIYRRKAELWAVEILEGLEATIELPEIEANLPLAELYFGVAFGAGA
jgi:Uma2 family endonuclease